MPRDVVVRLRDVRSALLDGVSESRDLRRVVQRFINDVERTWHDVWDVSMLGVLAQQTGVPHPYQTGDYKAHIKKKKLTAMQKLRIKKFLKGGMPIGLVYNNDEKAHWIEYGTKRDRPGSRSPWGPNTPTPAFEIMQRVARIMNEDVRYR
ncbi:hypothetical protein PORCELAIN_25 [Mycobacterium phage Porcelain]|uniref:minor tail protein n=1 Tax=Mycobacterium phage MiaZeal TaxID=1567005 RepID=UPI000540AC1F|nr:minor tail protein [Mycobacterium phage MiaZeal]AIY32379.1 hypothetical protein PBI_MIAZEAL_25 [Mycobacterium phage MiaZeal]ASD50665.1 hypothetical protein PORCELAIN_25 [Mycobacterium phage Porcelain]